MTLKYLSNSGLDSFCGYRGAYLILTPFRWVEVVWNYSVRIRLQIELATEVNAAVFSILLMLVP